MQHWTTSKPNRPGYWWVKNGENITFVLEVFYVKNKLHSRYNYASGNKKTSCQIDAKIFDCFMWGSSPICEPVGEKF